MKHKYYGYNVQQHQLFFFQGNSRERSLTVSPNGEDTDTIEQNVSEVDEDDFIFVEDLKNDEEKNQMDNVSLG